MNEITEINPFEKEHAILSTLPMFQPKYTNFFLSSLEGRNIEYLQSSPLALFKEKISDVGAHFHGFGKAVVKGANLAFRTICIDEQARNELDFKINHVFRSALQHKLDELSSMDRHVLNILLEKSESFGKKIRIQHDVPFPIGNHSIGNATEISIDGLGSVFISTSPEYPSIYNRVVVQMDAEKNIGDFHAILAFLNLEKSFQQSNQEDLQRHKIGHLFRTFYPRVAFQLERSETFFTLSIEEIKAKIIELVPDMANIFDTYLDPMTLEEILPGRLRYRIPGLAKRAYDLGARGLTSALTGACGRELYERTASILKSGMLSSETRKFLGCSVNGLSTSSDFISGGSDVVYTQMITEDNCRKNADFMGLNYGSDIRIIFSLDVLETGTYQYYNDSYGNRSTNSDDWWGSTPYAQRPGILEFISALQNSTLLDDCCNRNLQNIENSNLEEELGRNQRAVLRSSTEERRFEEEPHLIDVEEKGRLRVQDKTVDEFLSQLRSWSFSTSKNEIVYGGHEVMVKERIPPKYIQKILVSNERVREELIAFLTESNLIQDHKILGHSVEDFILVESKASDRLFV
ncbi:MAG TPA: hypothetical protein VLE96_01460 [Chlamydiales bacterium]|nr:hypothetical protein [Chlamydiales bacterium]